MALMLAGTEDVSKWRVQRINDEERPFALLGKNYMGDVFLGWSISEEFAPVLAHILGVEFLG